MLLLLPPSETKRDGGIPGTKLSYSALTFPTLTSTRRSVVSAIRELAKDEAAALVALKLGPTQAGEVLRNRRIATSPVLPAIDRYDGVLYDALDAATLSDEARAFAASTVAIASAAFGLTMASDLIPAYRLSHDSRVPNLRLAATWRDRVAHVISSYEGLILDLRSEAYCAFGPAPRRAESVFVRVVTDGVDGRRRALNHFNKHGKGEFVRSIVTAGVRHRTVDSLRDWASSAGHRLDMNAAGELELVV
ncbi:MAG TPA: peroxide stress protein YaaA [Pseudolysinimonas sp.]|nr:peroxide stress protein YaaA [Pseudolysinimonas sp.]